MNIKIIKLFALSIVSLTIQCVEPFTRIYNQANERKLEEESSTGIHNQEFQRRLQGGYTAAVKEYSDRNNINFEFNFKEEKVMLFNPEILAGQVWIAHLNRLGRTIAKIVIKGGFGKEEGKIMAFETYNTSNK